jgi:hypothetical protein
MRHVIGWFLVSALFPMAPALAAEPAAPLAPVHSLSEAEVDRILDEAAAKHRQARPMVDDLEDGRPVPPVQGEVGFGIGTGGYRSVYGTAVVPLDDGYAILSFDRTNLGRRNRVYRHPHDY